MWPSKVLGEPMATETKILDQKLEEGWKILQCTCPCDMMSLTVSTRRRHSFEALIKLYCYSATNSVSFKIFKATVSYVVLLCERKYRSFWVLCLQWLSLCDLQQWTNCLCENQAWSCEVIRKEDSLKHKYTELKNWNQATQWERRTQLANVAMVFSILLSLQREGSSEDAIQM